MALVRWDPWGDFAALQRDANEAFGRMFGQSARRIPPMDVYHGENGLVVHLELPGLSPADVEVSVTDGRLTISGEQHAHREEHDGRWVRRERSLGRFVRSFSLPPETDVDKISASFEHGVLCLEIPHTAAQKPHKVEVVGGDTQTDAEQPAEAGASA